MSRLWTCDLCVRPANCVLDGRGVIPSKGGHTYGPWQTTRKPAMPIDKGLPGPRLLAHLITSKLIDHLPLHQREPVCALLVEVVLRWWSLHTDNSTLTTNIT